MTEAAHPAEVELSTRLAERLDVTTAERAVLAELLGAVKSKLTALAAAKAAADDAVARLTAEVQRGTEAALAISRHFEHEAAARTEAEQVAAQLRAEHEQLAARAADLETRLAQALEAASGAHAEAAKAKVLAAQWQADADRAKGTAGRALAELHAQRDAGALSELDSEHGEERGRAPHESQRSAAERELAERQAANREMLRRARDRDQGGPRRGGPG
jgi:hypothetical protein